MFGFDIPIWLLGFWNGAKTFLGLIPKQVYLVLAGIGLLYGSYLYGHHKGYVDCSTKTIEAYAQGVEAQRAKDAKEAHAAAEKALTHENEMSKTLNEIKEQKLTAEKRARELAKAANRPITCNLSTDELQYYNSAVKDANGG